jgi:hypothetical protein
MELRGKTDPGAILTVNGETAAIDKDGSFAVSVPLGSEGVNIIRLAARDAVFNSEEMALTVLRDTVLIYNITSPKNGESMAARSVIVAGDAESGATITVSSLPVSLFPNGTFFLEVPLEYGQNTITVAIRDKAGNAVNETMTVTRLKASKPAASKGFIPGFEGVLLLAALSISSAVLIHRKR